MNADEGLRAAIATYLAALMARGYSAEQAKAAALELLDEERKARIQNRRKALRVVDNWPEAVTNKGAGLRSRAFHWA
jgi:hypothetical protein